MTTANFLEMEAYRARPALFSLRGRIGRARYVVYGIGSLCGAFLLMVLAGYGLYLSSSFGRMLYQLFAISLYFCALPVFFMQLTIRRAHDFNVEGWLALLLLVPVVNLLFWFIPGTRGENNYGAQPEGETAAMKIAAVVLPVLMIAAFLAADTKFPGQENERPAAAQPATPLRPYIP
jgi:uncharacterized membrane protein YhaH (DUF805 family)